MLGMEGINNMPRPGAFKTICPIHTCRTLRRLSFGYWDGEFDDFFELFMAGELEYNDYFDHLLDWYPHRNDPNVFYTRFEDMKKDMKSVVLKFSKFLGQEYIDAIEKDNNVLNNILQYSGFDYMKKKLSEVHDIVKRAQVPAIVFEGHKHCMEFAASLNPPEKLPEMQFVRKGIVGDWQNHFTPDQSERLNKKMLEKLKGTEVLQWYPVE
ncbi:sulfotransferase family cytosolic 1B member 1 [Trichonephila inaurata madagascariensis]|uniref:Sulfotransferase family cytosolic 1B member 1 n=1 Tax=Trichonephila inaurata madagascariensis TaxID=2747483 RepID=A0A8X7CQB4_9ARAC|nr:sulfotransferase family cytosolic 1B member 1 [Trichonephila inaurata madagascariensis]